MTDRRAPWPRTRLSNVLVWTAVALVPLACSGPDFTEGPPLPLAQVDAGSDVDETPIILPLPAAAVNDASAARTDAPANGADDASVHDEADATVEREADSTVDWETDANLGADIDTVIESGGENSTHVESNQSTIDGGKDGSGAGFCSSGSLVCDGGCVASDVRHCGSCANDCTNLPRVVGATTCAGGDCSFSGSSCASGWADCNGVVADGCETDLTRVNTCGDCATKCSGGTPLCGPSDGGHACISGCPASTPTLCAGACVETASSVQNCGACGNACTTSIAHAQPACDSGACTWTCNAGYSACNGACVDEQADANNCGGCGAAHACPAGMTCQAGGCGCPAGTHDCGGTCQSNTSLGSCGAACNTPCPGPANGGEYGAATCNGTACGIVCNEPYTLCGQACVDEQSDSNNCGVCGSACGAGTTCIKGGCGCNATSCPNGCCTGNACGAQPLWYQDADGDGAGNSAVVIAACAKPAGYVANGTDCCDSDANAHPGQTAYFATADACGHYDYNCDGVETPEPNQVGPTNCTGFSITCDPASCAATCTSSCGSTCYLYDQPPCGGDIGMEIYGCTKQGPTCLPYSVPNDAHASQACN